MGVEKAKVTLMLGPRVVFFFSFLLLASRLLTVTGGLGKKSRKQ